MESACNFTKINTPPWVFFTFFKLYKWYQIAQRTTTELLISQIMFMIDRALDYVITPQNLLLILSEFKRINQFLFLLKSMGNLCFSADFRGNGNQLFR